MRFLSGFLAVLLLLMAPARAQVTDPVIVPTAAEHARQVAAFQQELNTE